MYLEFIPIYIGLFVNAVLSIVVLILVIRCLSKFSGPKQISKMNAFQDQGAVVFCKKCSAQYRASQGVCPKCGTPK